MVCHIGLFKRIMSDFMGCLGFGTRHNDDEEPIYDADIDSLGTFVRLLVKAYTCRYTILFVNKLLFGFWICAYIFQGQMIK